MAGRKCFMDAPEEWLQSTVDEVFCGLRLGALIISNRDRFRCFAYSWHMVLGCEGTAATNPAGGADAMPPLRLCGRSLSHQYVSNAKNDHAYRSKAVCERLA
jgi:hypothetical protein